MKLIHPASFVFAFSLISPTQVFAGSVNGSPSGDPGSDLRPNCDYRRVTLNKCDENVRKNLRENCYVVVHNKNSPQSSMCTWQSCAGLSLVSQKPRFTVVKSAPPKVFELDEYGIRTQVTAPSLPTSWNCNLTHCLPKAEPMNGSAQKDFNGSFEYATVFPRTYLTLGEAIDLKSNASKQSSPPLEEARLLLQRPEVDNVMRANPYFSCAMVSKLKFWVERKSDSNSFWNKTPGLDGSSEYTVDAGLWKDSCRKNRQLDGMGYTYRCTTESGETLREASDALVWMDYFYSNKWQSTYNTYRSTNWKADCAAKIVELKKGNNFKWRCRNDQTGETLE